MIGCRVEKRVQLPLEFGAEGAKDTFTGCAFVSDFWEGESQVGACFSQVVLTLRLDENLRCLLYSTAKMLCGLRICVIYCCA